MRRRTSQRRGWFITFEGPEGSGKSTQSRRLVQALRRMGRRVTVVRDPGSTALGRALRRVLLHSRAELSPLAEALLFIGGRVQLVEELINPALAKGRVVVCDRFHDSTVAYQGYAGALDVAWLEAMGRQVVRRLPDLTIVLDLPSEVGFSRIRRAHDRMERKTRRFHAQVRRGYLALARRHRRRIVVVDARQSPERIRVEIERVVRARLARAR